MSRLMMTRNAVPIASVAALAGIGVLVVHLASAQPVQADAQRTQTANSLCASSSLAAAPQELAVASSGCASSAPALPMYQQPLVLPSAPLQACNSPLYAPASMVGYMQPAKVHIAVNSLSGLGTQRVDIAVGSMPGSVTITLNAPSVAPALNVSPQVAVPAAPSVNVSPSVVVPSAPSLNLSPEVMAPSASTFSISPQLSSPQPLPALVSPAADEPDAPKGNNGVGNGDDPQPPGNPPVNDGSGTGPGNPGNQGHGNDNSSQQSNANDNPKGNNGVGNGVDPQPPGDPPINDGEGTSPGDPGNRGHGQEGANSDATVLTAQSSVYIGGRLVVS